MPAYTRAFVLAGERRGDGESSQGSPTKTAVTACLPLAGVAIVGRPGWFSHRRDCIYVLQRCRIEERASPKRAIKDEAVGGELRPERRVHLGEFLALAVVEARAALRD